jgi:carbon-monoxide dehydrogenase large subunit
VEFTAPNPRSYGPSGAPVAAVDTVTVTLELSGEVTARASVSEIGQGVRQSLSQVIADAVGVAAGLVSVETGDTGTVPHGGGAWGSRGAAIGGEAAWRAGVALRDQVLCTAGALLQASPEALDIRDGRVVERATGMDRMGLDEVARIVTLQGYLLPDGVQPQLSVSHAYRRERDAALPNNGIQASLVELDAETGMVRALRHWVVFDCGRVLNPLLVEEQVRGGVVMGLGEALLEACRYDEAGQFVSGTLVDYLVPMATEAPDIAVAFVETPYEGSNVGAKGAGEAGTCAAPAAILNAVNDALDAAGGGSVTAFPITPLAILHALGRLETENAA